METLLPWQQEHLSLTLHSELDEVHIWYDCSLGQRESTNDLVAMEILLPWQQEHLSVGLHSEIR